MIKNSDGSITYDSNNKEDWAVLWEYHSDWQYRTVITGPDQYPSEYDIERHTLTVWPEERMEWPSETTQTTKTGETI